MPTEGREELSEEFYEKTTEDIGSSEQQLLHNVDKEHEGKKRK